jgi:hypothetical protein
MNKTDMIASGVVENAGVGQGLMEGGCSGVKNVRENGRGEIT